MRHLLPLLLVLTASAAVQPLRAQSTGPLAEYWRALENSTSPDAVRLPSAPRDSAVAQGLYLLRRWELEGDRAAAATGRRELERLVARAPDDAWAHFALGALLARGPDVREVMGDADGGYVIWRHSLAAQRAPRVLRRALALDPSLDEAAYMLARLALDLGDQSLMGEAADALARDGRERLPRALALRAEILQALGELRQSVQLADSARLLGGDAAVSAHLAAAALLQLPGRETEGAQVYFRGVQQLSEAAAAAYFDAIGAIAPPERIEVWRAAGLSERKAWLQRFWSLEAALSGVPVAERLAEHYRRLAQVRSEGRVAPMGAAAASGAVDARRYGVPSFGALMLLRHGDERRAERVLYCGGDVLELPLPLQPTPEECARTPGGRLRASSPYPRLVRLQAQDRASPGSSYYPPFETHLALSWEAVQFRGPEGRTEVVAALALPTPSARALVQERVLTARTELILIDTADGGVIRSERVQQFAAPALPQDAHVLLAVSALAERRGSQLFRIALTDRARRAGRIVGGSLTVRDFASGELALSDVVVAPLDGTPAFERGEQRLSLAPGRELRRTESVALYYEIYGLAEGEAYRTEITIQPEPNGVLDHLRALFPGAPDAQRLSFTEEAGAVHAVYGIQQLRTVGLEGLVPGRYRLRVAVTDAGGTVAVQERVLWVVVGEEE